MKPNQPALRYFLGFNTPQGFVSRFEQLCTAENGNRCFIIKGGPGSGKSTMLRRIYNTFSDRFSDMELIYCSSDAASLDALVIPALKASIVDGAFPHTVEPQYPGAVESLINLSACWDEKKLCAHRDEIVSLSTACRARYEHCHRFLNAAAILSNDSYHLALESLDAEKLSAYADRLSERELKPRKGRTGTESIRLLSALTDKGVITYLDSAKALCKKLYMICDDYGAISRILLHKLRSRALVAGYHIITSYCPLCPFDKIEHILIPEAGIGFITSNREHDFSLMLDPYRIVNSKRFLDLTQLKKGKRRFAFNRKAERQMIGQAELLMSEAKVLHDELEGYYAAATDFTMVDSITNDLIKRLEEV